MSTTPTTTPNLSHFVRAVLAIGLTAALPVMLFVNVTASADLLQAYQDVLAAVVAFYFGATATPTS
jgi:hypothetical protein